METNAPKPSGVRGTIFVISAPSGSGKTTLAKLVIASLPEVAFSISCTTRPPRGGEEDGRDYFFVPRRKFEEMIAAGEFLEWADVVGHLYGTSKGQVERAIAAGRDVLLDIDVQGHQQVRERLPEVLSIFVMPPSYAELRRRLVKRHLDSPLEVEKRLAAARREITRWTEYDYVIINDLLPQATEALLAIVRAGRVRRQNQAERAREICSTFGG
jgi:guanylate kinase